MSSRTANIFPAHSAAAQRHRERIIEIVTTEKQKPCMDCKVSYSPWVMQYDHRESETKLFNISEAATLFPGESVLREEIAKCDVVCANCHAERTHSRREKKRQVKRTQYQRWLEGRGPKPSE